MSGISTGRRRLLALGGAVFAGSLAGCLGDESREQAHEMLEDTEEYHVQITQEFDDDQLEAHLDAEEWGSCVDLMADVEATIEDGRQTGQDGRAFASNEGLEDYVAAFDAYLDLFEVLDEMATEITLGCEAGQEGDEDALIAHFDTVDDLDQDRLAAESDLEAALEAL